MNKILKRLVGLFIIGIGILNICDADNVFDTIVSAQNIYSINTVNLNNSSYVNLFNYNSPNSIGNMFTGAGTYCISITSTSPQTLDMGFANGPTTAPTNLYKLYNDQYNKFVCLYGNKPYLNAKLNSSTNSVNVIIFNLEQLLESEAYLPKANVNIYDRNGYRGNINFNTGDNLYIINDLGVEEIFKLDDNTYQIYTYQTTTGYCVDNNLCPACEECQQCQTCPTIDAQYCMNNFNLIPPAYCPICGTGDVNWSSLYINGIQYNGNEIIDIHTEDQMETDVDYLNDTVDIDITYGQDEEYIENIIAQEKVTPTNEDFENLMYIVGEFIPYLFITLLIFFFVKIINKVRRR